LKFQVIGPPLLWGEVVLVAGLFGAVFDADLGAGFAAAFLALAGAAFFAGFFTAAFFAAFFATFFLATFIPLSPCPEMRCTFSAFQRAMRGLGITLRG
jgi:hypothetical protein